MKKISGYEELEAISATAESQSLVDFLRSTTRPSLVWHGMPTVNSSMSGIKWEVEEVKPEKELTEKQLFTKLKKEIKEVSVKLN